VAERERLREERKRDLGEKRESGQVMLSGEVSVQGAGSMVSSSSLSAGICKWLTSVFRMHSFGEGDTTN